MKKHTLLFSSVILPISMSVSAVPQQYQENGHWYDIVPFQGSWAEARKHAEKQSFQGLQGQLATLTSEQESNFISHLSFIKNCTDADCQQKHSAGIWLGGYQTSKSEEPLGEWAWISGEKWTFANWHNGEPNDFANSEDVLVFMLNGQWNDQINSNQVGVNSYVIEYQEKTDEKAESDCVAEFVVLNFSTPKTQYKSGEIVAVNLLENLKMPSRTEFVDLWVTVELPNGEFLYVTDSPSLFDKKPQPFKKFVDSKDKVHKVLNFKVLPELNGKYTFHAVYVKTGKNPVTDGFLIHRSNVAKMNIILSD